MGRLRALLRGRTDDTEGRPVEQAAEPASAFAALDELIAKNQRQPDGERDRSLRNLRSALALEHEPDPGRSTWPPVYADPFPDLTDGLPEIEPSDLTTEILGGAVAHHGCLIVRHAFDDRQVREAVELIERAKASADAHAETEAVDAWYDPLIVEPPSRNAALRAMVLRQGGMWLADSPAATERLLHSLEQAGITKAIAGHFGERPYFSLQKSTLRRSEPEDRLSAWHQDGSFLSRGTRTMNTWVALSRCGGDAPTPGLEVIPRRIDEILPVDGVMSPHSISYDLVAELAEVTPTLIPAFEPGDAFMFDERFVHRTHFGPGMTEVRYALECWFFAPSHVSSDYSPLVV